MLVISRHPVFLLAVAAVPIVLNINTANEGVRKILWTDSTEPVFKNLFISRGDKMLADLLYALS